ncbi:MAG: adenylate/guanylate cyclase domain-containing protein [Psychroserpens sp.]|uniref:adenylate/guanylate cyclase domain-containing protein n=1 Tax=Psychroserpens sp. TaxID=2020870 RepID=UPI0030011825
MQLKDKRLSLKQTMKERKERQLAAIMFTDIVEYTALMQGNEKVAASARARHREVFQKLHDFYQGEIIQYYGDGTLSVFKSAIEAVNCAVEIQNLLQEGDPVPLRIGLHLGDIVFDNTEVYGDGVNFASRIESLGSAGTILLSEKINDELKNHTTISTTSLGHFELKNIDRPAEVFAITNKGIKLPRSSDLKNKQKTVNNTIAVLPFVNFSDSKDNEYFSDGITEEIINALAKIRNLKVTSRTSSFFFKGKNLPITEIGEKLGVSAILEGSVRLTDNSLRITAQLIQVKEDYHFWSETWDRKLENVFEIQDEISLLIADKLREHFGHLEINETLVTKQTENINAYEHCLKAKFHENKWNPEDMKIAISYYEKALGLDSNYAEAHLGLAGCYSFLGTTAFIPFDEAWKKTNKHTTQALQLNGQSSGVHYQLSNQAFFIECDYSKSLREIKKAIKINPNNAEAQQFISFLYILAGQHEKSHIHLEIALSINPLSEETRFFKAYFHYMTEDYLQSLELLDQCLAVNDKNIPAHSVKSICLLKLCRYDEAINYFDNIPAEVVIQGEKTGAIGLAYALKKDTVNASIYLEKLIAQSKEENGFTADSYLFMMYAVNGDHDKAFNWVAQAIENNSSLLLLRYADPLVNPIKNDPRYDAFQKKLFQTDQSEGVVKQKTALLNAEKSAEYSTRLLGHLSENESFLNPDLSLRDLANQIEIHPNHLSWLLNNSFGKNYNEFINTYRIEAFKVNAKAQKNAHLTIEGLAYESGFNSKTVFNTYFKKETGLTPKQFLKL